MALRVLQPEPFAARIAHHESAIRALRRGKPGEVGHHVGIRRPTALTAHRTVVAQDILERSHETLHACHCTLSSASGVLLAYWSVAT